MKLCSTLQVEVPAKAMLWGEYGVIYGGPAVVATLPGMRFVCEFEFFSRVDNGYPAFSIRSKFFPSGEVNLSLEELKAETQPSCTESHFFWGIGRFWLDLFESFSVVLKVSESFSPSLGFGSSSALVAACSRAFFYQSSNNSAEWLNLDFFSRLRNILNFTQGGGSGYDVVVQCAALSFGDKIGKNCDEIVFWEYRNTASLPVVRTVPLLNIREFGLLIESGVYSKTSRVFSEFSNREKFAALHASLAEEIINGEIDLPAHMSRSRQISREQGLMGADSSKFAQLCAKLDEVGVPWKTMGAGHGDCVWVAASREVLCEVEHPVFGGSICDRIIFDFSRF